MRSQSQTRLSAEDTTENDLVTKKKKKILPFTTIWVDLEGIVVVVVAVVQSLSHV